MSDFDRIDDIQANWDIAVQSLLQKRGWHHTSATPDSVWMWEKEHNGKVYSVSEQRALAMERNGIWV